jgi:hypothetical protein
MTTLAVIGHHVDLFEEGIFSGKGVFLSTSKPLDRSTTRPGWVAFDNGDG